jgi:hypothetical protein
MPICEIDPWRMQYFEHVACPADVFISTEDSDSWTWYPRHRWVYDKVAVALSQGLAAAPHGVEPPTFPMFSKPITNLKGMGVGSRVLRTPADYVAHYAPGHMWMTLLDGRHVSSDVAVVDGRATWWRHATGRPGPEGTFEHWTIHAAADPEIEARAGDWIAQHLAGYTGMINLETIGGQIIEVHLRFADQWPDLYGAGWVEALVRLYRDGSWDYPDADRRDGFSVVLFGPHGPHYRHPPQSLIDEIRATPSVSSVQITFHENKAPDQHAMPPGGFRLAIVNGFDLSVGESARERLRAFFLSNS